MIILHVCGEVWLQILHSVVVYNVFNHKAIKWKHD